MERFLLVRFWGVRCRGGVEVQPPRAAWSADNSGLAILINNHGINQN